MQAVLENIIFNNRYIQLLRLHKPIGTLLLLWPTWIALFFASNKFPPLKEFIIFSLGVIIMRAAGCVINDIADKDIDKLVSRTQYRPITSGKIKSNVAWIIFFVLCILAFTLVLFLNKLTIYLSIVAVFLASLYPFSKRFTNFPQLFLSLAFGFGIIMAFSATNNSVSFVGVLLYIGVICWIIAFDTLYALVDLEDDIKVGIKSSAIAFGDYAREIILILNLTFLIVLFLIGIHNNLSYIFFIGLILSFSLIVKIHKSTTLQTKDRYFKAFLSNNNVGASLFFFTLLDVVNRQYFL